MTDHKLWWNERNASWNSEANALFTETLTRNGIGYTFNMLEVEDLLNFTLVSDDFKYLSPTKKPMPWSTKADEGNGLKISMTKNRFLVKNYFNCHENRFMVHSPFELPDSTEGFDFGYGLSLEILISVNVIQTDESVRSLSLKKRKCYFENERRLKFFKSYTKSNCERECLTIVTYEKCNCVPFYYIRNKTMNVCDIPGVLCAWRYLQLDYDKYNYYYETQEICNCLSPCDSVTYNVEGFANKYAGNFSEGWVRGLELIELIT